MAAPPNTYYRYRQWVNCQNGGYLEDYNFNPTTFVPGGIPPSNLLQAVNWIVQLRGQLLEFNSKIANGEISVETLPGQNPPEGFQVPHNVPSSSPIQLWDPITGATEPTGAVANDPEQCIAYRLDTRSGFTELRTLRSIRATWVNEWATLYPQIVTQIGIYGAIAPPVLANAPGYPASAVTTAAYIAFFMLFLVNYTCLVQLKPKPSSVTSFAFLNFQVPNSVLSPPLVNPIVSPQLARRKVGEGWPKTRGKMQTFGTHG